MRRIAAYNLKSGSRSVSPRQVRSALFVPLEKYLITLAEDNGESWNLNDLAREAARVAFGASDRKKIALAYANDDEKLSQRISQMYERYRS